MGWKDGLADDSPMVFNPPRAEDFDEFKKKLSIEPYESPELQEICRLVVPLAKELSVPRHIYVDACNILRRVKNNAIPIAGRVPYKKKKALLALLYVLAQYYEDHQVKDKIMNYECEPGQPCFINKKNNDREFIKYVKLYRRIVESIRPKKARNIISYLVYVMDSGKLPPAPDSVKKTAIEIAKAASSLFGGKDDRTIAAACIYLAYKMHGLEPPNLNVLGIKMPTILRRVHEIEEYVLKTRAIQVQSHAHSSVQPPSR